MKTLPLLAAWVLLCLGLLLWHSTRPADPPPDMVLEMDDILADEPETMAKELTP